MNKITFIVLLLTGIILSSIAVSTPTIVNKLFTASISSFTPPSCPFEIGFTPAKIPVGDTNAFQKAILLKTFFTTAVIDANNKAICTDADNITTCIARFSKLCYSQGKCSSYYQGEGDATLTSELKEYLCSIWNQRYNRLFNSWAKVTSSFNQRNIEVPNFLTESYNTYQQYLEQLQKQNKITTTTRISSGISRRNIDIEDRILLNEEEKRNLNFTVGDSINLGQLDIKSNSLSLNPNKKDINSNSLNKNQDFTQFTMDNPRIRIYQNPDGSYSGEWFVLDAPGGPINIKIVDQNGKEIYSEITLKAGGPGVLFKSFDIDANKLDPNQKYKIIISGEGKSGSYSFDGKALTNGAAIIDNVITTQYNPKNSYLYYINGAVSPDKKTLSLDLQVGKATGPTLASDIKTLVVRNTKTGETQTITGDELLKVLGGGKLNINLDLTTSNDFVVELLNSSNKTIESYQGTVTDSGLLQLSQITKGASGHGSVYDPIVNYSSHQTATSYSLSINISAAGASVTKVIDAATGEVIGSYNGGNIIISGSNNKFKQGYSYYIVMYDQMGNIANTQLLQLTGEQGCGFVKLTEINNPPTLSSVCGGQYKLGVSGTIKTININGKSYTLEEAKSLFNTDFLSLGQIVLNRTVSASLKNITVTYIDSFGIEQTATFKVENGKIIMDSFSNKLVQLKPPENEIVGTPIVLNNGTKLTYYKNDQTNIYYIQAENYKGLKIQSIHFGYDPYDKNPLYIQQVIKQFNETGILPAGAYIVFEDGTTIDTSSKGDNIGKYGPIYIREDKTKKIEEEKIIVDQEKGIINIPINKIDDKEATKELENNELYNDPIVKSLIDEAKNDSYCKTHTCGFSEGAYTVTINPFTGKITVEVDEDLKKSLEAKKKAEEEQKIEQEKQELVNSLKNYEKTLTKMVEEGMIDQKTGEELYRKRLEEIANENPEIPKEEVIEPSVEPPVVPPSVPTSKYKPVLFQ